MENFKFVLPKRNKIKFETIEEFEIIKELGSGAFSTVYLIRHLKTGEQYAMKKIQFLYLSALDQENIQKEIEIHKDLDSQYVVKLIDFLKEDNTVYLILEYSEKGNLYDYIMKRARLPIQELKSFFHDISKGIQYLHNNNIVMRDLKPENCLLDEQKRIKLCDFGWAVKIQDFEYRSIKAGTMVYMSPESLKGELQNFSSDIWSLGVLLYELFFMNLPFYEITIELMLEKILLKNIDYSKGFIIETAKNLIDRMIVNEPEKRINIEDVINSSFLKSDEYRIYIDKAQKVKLERDHSVNLVQEDNSKRLDRKPDKKLHIVTHSNNIKKKSKKIIDINKYFKPDNLNEKESPIFNKNLDPKIDNKSKNFGNSKFINTFKDYVKKNEDIHFFTEGNNRYNKDLKYFVEKKINTPENLLPLKKDEKNKFYFQKIFAHRVEEENQKKQEIEKLIHLGEKNLNLYEKNNSSQNQFKYKKELNNSEKNAIEEIPVKRLSYFDKNFNKNQIKNDSDKNYLDNEKKEEKVGENKNSISDMNKGENIPRLFLYKPKKEKFPKYSIQTYKSDNQNLIKNLNSFSNLDKKFNFTNFGDYLQNKELNDLNNKRYDQEIKNNFLQKKDYFPISKNTNFEKNRENKTKLIDDWIEKNSKNPETNRIPESELPHKNNEIKNDYLIQKDTIFDNNSNKLINSNNDLKKESLLQKNNIFGDNYQNSNTLINKDLINRNREVFKKESIGNLDQNVENIKQSLKRKVSRKSQSPTVVIKLDSSVNKKNLDKRKDIEVYNYLNHQNKIKKSIKKLEEQNKLLIPLNSKNKFKLELKEHFQNKIEKNYLGRNLSQNILDKKGETYKRNNSQIKSIIQENIDQNNKYAKNNHQLKSDPTFFTHFLPTNMRIVNMKIDEKIKNFN